MQCHCGRSRERSGARFCSPEKEKGGKADGTADGSCRLRLPRRRNSSSAQLRLPACAAGAARCGGGGVAAVHAGSRGLAAPNRGARRPSGAPRAPPFLLRLKMAAEVDFGDRELFEQLEEEDGPPPPRLSVDEEEEAREEAFSELRERLRGCEETVRRLRAENILTGLAGPAAGGDGGLPPAAGSLPGQAPRPALLPRSLWGRARGCGSMRGRCPRALLPLLGRRISLTSASVCPSLGYGAVKFLSVGTS